MERKLFTLVAQRFKVDHQELESDCRSSNSYILVENFLTAKGSHVLYFFKSGPTSVNISDTLPAKQDSMCAFFVRQSNKPITSNSFSTDVYFGFVHSSLLQDLSSILSHVLSPSLHQSHDVNSLDTSHKELFLSALDNFTIAVNDSLTKHAIEENDLDFISPKFLFNLTPSSDSLDFSRASQDPEVVSVFEKTMFDWCKQLERFIAENNQVRQESVDSGPLSEIEHWKHRMSKFNSIRDYLENTGFIRIIVSVLNFARSSSLDHWKSLQRRVKDVAIEAEDNLKYLYTIDKVARPLYSPDPVQITDCLHQLLNAISMVHTVTRFYNTNERLTGLFVKITNQMVVSCKKYLFMGNEESFWNFSSVENIVSKLSNCTNLGSQYRLIYRKVKDSLSQVPTGRQFDLSEAYIFGPMDLFVKRVESVLEIVTTFDQFRRLLAANVSSLDLISEKHAKLYDDFKKKHVNPFEEDQINFEKDFNRFNNQTNDLEKQLISTIDELFACSTSTERSLELLEQISAANITRDLVISALNSKYPVVFLQYSTDLEAVRRQYQLQASHPPIPRNQPPVAGAINWSRQLLRRIQVPMELFSSKAPYVLSLPDGRKVVRIYNRLAEALVEYENLYFKAWLGTVKTSRQSLHSTILTRNSKSNLLTCNYPNTLSQLITESRWLSSMGLEIPSEASSLLAQEEKLKNLRDLTSQFCLDYGQIMSDVKPSYKSLITHHLIDLEQRISPGLSQITWSSVNSTAFLTEISTSLRSLKTLIQEVNDIVTYRIDSVLKDIKDAKFVVFPESPVDPNDFVTLIENNSEEVSHVVEEKSRRIESSVKDLINLVKPISEQELDSFETIAIDYYEQIKKQCFLTIMSSITSSIRSLKNRFGKVPQPLFKGTVSLYNGVVEFSPSNNLLTSTIVSVVKSVSKATRTITHWKSCSDSTFNFKDTLSLGTRVSISRDVSVHTPLVKVCFILTMELEKLKPVFTEFANLYTKFSAFWQEDPALSYQKFVEKSPSLSDYDLIFSQFDDICNDVDKFKSIQILGGLVEVNRSPLHSQIKSLVLERKSTYSTCLIKSLQSQMKSIEEQLQGSLTKLTVLNGKEDFDLEDVRDAMIHLSHLRTLEADKDLQLLPISNSFILLERHNVGASKEDCDELENIHAIWTRVNKTSSSLMLRLKSLQPQMRTELINSVQLLITDVKKLKEDYDLNGPMVKGIPLDVASERLKLFKAAYAERDRKCSTFSVGEELFNLPITEYPELIQIRRELRLLDSLYSLHASVMTSVSGFGEVLWVDKDLDAIGSQLSDYQQKCRRLPASLREWDAYHQLKQMIDSFYETLPLLQLLGNECMRARHWDEIQRICSYQIRWDADDLLLKEVIEAPLLLFKEDVEEIANAAVKEREIEHRLNQIESDWRDQKFFFTEYKSRGLLLLKPTETAEIVALLEDSQMILGGLISSRYNAPFKSRVVDWINKLSTCSERIDLWLRVQFLWVYLEAVFSGGDIANQLPQEAKRFAGIDKSWVKIMNTAVNEPHCVSLCCSNETLENLLPHMIEQLELCQKSLAHYLESKRSLFPRFYFVSDAQLLEILGQASDPNNIQSHLKSISENIGKVIFDKVKTTEIIALQSLEGEIVPLVKRVIPVGAIESWLTSLIDSMQLTIRCIARAAASYLLPLSDKLGIPNNSSEDDESAHSELIDFITRYPAQITLLGLQMLWTKQVEDALRSSKFDKNAMNFANKLCSGIMSLLVDLTTRDLGPEARNRTKVEALVTIQVHQRDILDELIQQRIKNAYDFEWLKQTRFYWREEQDHAMVSITDIDFEYSYEYLGCTDRLVITPLTDRCYITLAQALGMFLGGAPAGPAGTGKTETVKDMGKALGKYVVVFNCSDQMDVNSLGKIFKGLAESGAWGCFDEFNRILLPVLSVVAQQIQCVLIALREQKTSFVFSDGETCKLNPRCGIFITMNPGYAGRQELPENLKVLMRSVAMMVPNFEIIMRVKLASAGFQQNQMLAKKFDVLYMLCKQQLSQQRHYDFGLRNILSVLRTCGAWRRQDRKAEEVDIFLRVVRDMNLSKLVGEDEPLFLSLVNDLFPGQTVENSSYPSLEAAIENNVKKAGLVNHPAWILKVIQLYETCLVRHGVMVLGPAGAGKSKCIDILMKALTDCGTPHKSLKINPKAITDQQMFGKLDRKTGDWTDGIFSAIWRKLCRKVGDEKNWIILDGPVDTIWIESLNTVLDDTKTLTLANSDRIPMAPNMKLIVEVHSLANASPATVSRAGMIYMSHNSLGWEPVFQSWLLAKEKEGFNSEILQGLNSLFENHINSCFTFIKVNCLPVMSLFPQHQVTQCFKLLEALVPSPNNDFKLISNNHLERMFVFALIWSLGAVLEKEDRQKFDLFLRGDRNLDLPSTFDSETVYDYWISSETGEWQKWRDLVPDYEYPADHTPSFSTVLVPTIDSVRSMKLIDLIAKQGLPVMLIGEAGTAKSVTINSWINERTKDEQWTTKSVSFSFFTTPLIFQRTTEACVEKRLGTTYGPKAGRKMIYFLDDVNMPEINVWGDQETSEIARQLIEDKGFYNLDRPGEWISIVDLFFMAAMQHPGGGRNDIPDRLKRHFAIYNSTLPSKAAVEHVYSKILKGYFTTSAPRSFSSELSSVLNNIIPMTFSLWDKVKQKLLPTPSKFHYMFNLRDLSRITQGLLTVTNEHLKSPSQLVSLWKHECCRVLSDRFIDPNDLSWFNSTLNSIMEEEVPNYYKQSTVINPFYVDFMRDAAEPDPDRDPSTISEEELLAPKIYESVDNLDLMRERLGRMMELFNETSRSEKLDLVFFHDAVAHLTRISRIIRTEQGHALLVGVGGSGKQSLTKLASFIAGYKTVSITLTKNYSTKDLLEDFQKFFMIAGLEGKGVTLIFTDKEIKHESFLEYVNNILTSGEIPGLFAKDEMDSIISELSPVFKREKPRCPVTNDEVWQFFLHRVKKNLHVVLCFSPVGDKFRSRARKFPGLVSGCTIDYFFPWPEEALIEVAQKFTSSFEIDGSDAVKSSLVHYMAHLHTNVGQVCEEYFSRFRRRVYITPKSFLSFMSSYKLVYQRKRAEIGVLAERLNSGLAKLHQASEDVALMKVELADKKVKLAVAVEKAKEILSQITTQTAAAQKITAEVQAVKDDLASKAAGIDAEKKAAEKDLAAAKPALEDAQTALDQISAADITNVRTLRKPPNLICRILDGVLILRQLAVDPWTVDNEMLTEKNRTLPLPCWSHSVKMMSDTAFLSSLTNFSKECINDEICELLEPYLGMEDFTREAATTASGNVAGLCSWVRAMTVYHSVAKYVAPKIEAVARAEKELASANAALAVAEAELAEKQKILDEMQAKYDEAVSSKRALQEDAELTERRMTSANQLISGLSGERERWTIQSAEFKKVIAQLIGDVAVAAAFLSYAGPFNAEFRQLLLEEHWCKDLLKRKIPFSDNLSVIKLLTDDATIGEWNLQGLPTDDLSTQNGIIVTQASRYPLLIDPQGQAKSWLKSRESSFGLKITRLSDRYFRNTLEDCLQFGYPLIIEDVEEELDPVLEPILDKQYIKIGSRFKVKLGDKEVDVCDGFRLYLTTKLANPHFSPEISAKTSIVDFTVTLRGLESQLLGRVIETEKSELERSRQKLLEEVNANKKLMLQLEKNLVEKLASAGGNLLDDITLIDVLNKTKTTAEEVSEALKNAVVTEQRINEAREEYRAVATRGSILYFLIAEMSLVSNMYQSSLGQFLQQFDLGIRDSQTSQVTSKRVANIVQYLTEIVYAYVSRYLFGDHKILFVLLLALKVELESSKISPLEFGAMIKGGAALDIKQVRAKPVTWLSDSSWLNVIAVSHSCPALAGLPDQISNNPDVWKQWMDVENVESCPLPDPYTSLSVFATLLLVRSLREDRTMLVAQNYIKHVLGPKFIETVNLTLERTHQESTPSTPLVFFLSLGADPSADIEALSKQHKTTLHQVSMGQGQDGPARNFINQAKINGDWVLLQNCHLSIEFLQEIEVSFSPLESTHPNFRLFITTEPTVKFPIGLLQLSIKVASEAPQGIKAGLKRTYNWVTQDLLDQVDKPEWKPLFYTLTFFHSVLQERRRFGTLGWIIPYEFNMSDLTASVTFLQNLLYQTDSEKGISWTTMRYMICEIMYGRITDNIDRTLGNSLGFSFLNDKVLAPHYDYHTGYPLPIDQLKSITDLRNFLDTLPVNDPPTVLGLHSNADIAFRTRQCVTILDQILTIQPKDSAAGGTQTREEVANKMSIDMLRNLPADFDPIELEGQLQRLGRMKPLTIFLRQEVDRLQVVISTVRKELGELILAISGTIVMSQKLQDILTAITDGKVPALWTKISWQSSTLGFWLSDVDSRYQQLASWLRDGRPMSFWLGGFFNPQGFLTSTKQEIARAHTGWSLDTLNLQTTVKDLTVSDLRAEHKLQPGEGVYVHGLSLEGARWDRDSGRLAEQKLKELDCPLPVLYITATDSANSSQQNYKCPVFFSKNRQDHVFDVDLPSSKSPHHWTIRGVCLLCT
ncbi:hypothetical protein RCL1_005355 [Eukaryota sp. TZLM3-RCL]